MRRIWITLVCIVMLLWGCAPKTQVAVPAETAQPTAEILPLETEAPVEEPEKEQAPGPLTPETEARLRAMQPILDSILRTIGFINGTDYSAADTEQLWVRLYLMGVNFGGMDPRVTQEGIGVVVPRQLMYEWESAFSEAFNGLPDTPGLECMQYDAKRQVYILENSDMGDSETRVERTEQLEGGLYGVSIGVYQGDGERVGGMDFVLRDNPFLAGSGSGLLDTEDMAPVEQPVFFM